MIILENMAARRGPKKNALNSTVVLRVERGKKNVALLMCSLSEGKDGTPRAVATAGGMRRGCRLTEKKKSCIGDRNAIHVRKKGGGDCPPTSPLHQTAWLGKKKGPSRGFRGRGVRTWRASPALG